MTIPGDKRGVGGPSLPRVRPDAAKADDPAEAKPPAAPAVAEAKIWGAKGAQKTGAVVQAAALTTAAVDEKLKTIEALLSGASGLRAHRLDLTEQLYLLQLKDALEHTRGEVASGAIVACPAPLTPDDASRVCDELAAASENARGADDLTKAAQRSAPSLPQKASAALASGLAKELKRLESFKLLPAALKSARAERVNGFAAVNVGSSLALGTRLNIDDLREALRDLAPKGGEVRALDPEAYKHFVADRQKLLERKDLPPDARAQLEARTRDLEGSVAAFDPVSGNVVVSTEALNRPDFGTVLAHELTHRKMHALSNRERGAVTAAFLGSPEWPRLKEHFKSMNPREAGLNDTELVDEILAQALSEPRSQLASLAKPILESKTLKGLGFDKTPAVDVEALKRTGVAKLPTWKPKTKELELVAFHEADGTDKSAAWSRLNDVQKKALRDADMNAETLSATAHAQLVARAGRLGYSEADVAKVLAYVKGPAPVSINFYPNKAIPGGTVIDGMLRDGSYKNQFETGISGGSLGPTVGSPRDGWERTIFRNDYTDHGLIPQERPKYAALDAEDFAGGAAPSYGDSFMVLKQGAKNRMTFTPSNSSGARAEQVGTPEHFEHILNDPQVPDDRLKTIFDHVLGRDGANPAAPRSWGYIEAQIHGPVDFNTDIEKVVVNAQYHGMPDYDAKVHEFASKFHLKLEWSDGAHTFDDAHVPTLYTINGRSVGGPARPDGYTVMAYGDTVAFAPARADAPVPREPPPGYVAVRHETAGTLFLPERYAPGGVPNGMGSFGAVATGAPPPAVELVKQYQFPGGYYGAPLFGPPPPKGYTAVQYADTVAFVPETRAATPPAKAPEGFKAVTHPTAGTVYVPMKYMDGETRRAGYSFGATAVGFPEPEVAVAPPAPRQYQFPNGGAVMAPPTPRGYAAVSYGGNIAFVPATRDAAVPTEPPSGFVPLRDERLGTFFVPLGLTSAGARRPELTFGPTAVGSPPPVVPVSQEYKFTPVPGGYYSPPVVYGPPAPAGFTAVQVNEGVAFVPTSRGAGVPEPLPDGYVAASHPDAGTILLPTRFAPGGTMLAGLRFGSTAAGMPDPVVPVAPPPPVVYNFPFGSLYAPKAPPGYTVLQYGPGVAYVPTSRSVTVPSRAPDGYVAATHPEAGTVFVPAGTATAGTLSPGYRFGATATGMPAPVVELAPPPPRAYVVPMPYGGATTLSAPPPPEGYTAVGYGPTGSGGTIAFVPARRDAPTPTRVPDGYVAVRHPEAGTIYLPAPWAPGGTIPPGYSFGATATGMPEPVVPIAPPPPKAYTVSWGGAMRTVYAPPTPEGYTAIGYSDAIAFVPARRDAPTPAKVPDGYTAMRDETLGQVYVPSRYVSMAGAIPFGATAVGSPEPVVKVTAEYKFPTGGAPQFGPVAPKDYTVVLYGPLYAYVPAKRDAEVPSKPPPGFSAVVHPRAGTVFVPTGYLSGGGLHPGLAFGPPAIGMAEPAVSLAPTPQRVYTLTSPGGARRVSAPELPEGYTAVNCGDTVAFVPARAVVRAEPPDGYVAMAHPTAGMVFMPARYVSGGRLGDGVALGDTAVGLPAPAAPVAQLYTIAGRQTFAPPAPPGYTAMQYQDYGIAFVPATPSPPAPKVPWGYAAAVFPGSGTILLPSGYVRDGRALYPGIPFGAVADGMPEPGVTVVRR